MPVTTKLTRFPNGIAQYTFVAVPGAAGSLTCTGVSLLKDRILHVMKVAHTSGVPTGASDLTSEFSITADNTIDNTSGTSTSNALLFVTVARKY